MPLPSAGARSRARGDDARARTLAEDLADVDRESWAHLLPTLRRIARSVAPRFSRSLSADDVLGELVLGCWDGWLAAWSSSVLRGEERRSLELFLRDRLRDHLREERRKVARRRALLEWSGAAPASEQPGLEPPLEASLYSSAPPAPDARLDAEELRRAACADREARAVLALREAGFTQAEIAESLSLSRPTVSRRLVAVSALLLAALAAVAVAWSFGAPEPDDARATLEAEPDREASRPSEPAGGERADDEEASAEPSREAEPREPVGRPVDERADEPADAPADEATEDGADRAPGEPLEPPPGPAPQARVPPSQVRATGPGSLLVSSYARCSVSIDGGPARRAPLMERLAPGRHQLVARREGFAPYRQEIVIRPGRAERVEIRWPMPEDREGHARECSLVGDSECVIELLRDSASTALEHLLLVEAYRSTRQRDASLDAMEGFVRAFPTHNRAETYRTLLRRGGRPTPYFQAPETAPHGLLRIESAPPARIFVDGVDTHLRTPSTLRLTPGVHRVELHAPDGAVHRVSVFLRDGERTRVVRQL